MLKEIQAMKISRMKSKTCLKCVKLIEVSYLPEVGFKLHNFLFNIINDWNRKFKLIFVWFDVKTWESAKKVKEMLSFYGAAYWVPEKIVKNKNNNKRKKTEEKKISLWEKTRLV